MLRNQAGKGKSMNNNTVSDFLIRIKNAYLARHKTVETSYAKILLALGRILEGKGFVKSIRQTANGSKKRLLVTLSYPSRKPAITDIQLVSKPGLRIYARHNKIPLVYGGLGIVIVSTPKGLMDGKEARSKKLGGEVICKVW